MVGAESMTGYNEPSHCSENAHGERLFFKGCCFSQEKADATDDDVLAST